MILAEQNVPLKMVHPKILRQKFQKMKDEALDNGMTQA